jgi:hypothetical protein
LAKIGINFFCYEYKNSVFKAVKALNLILIITFGIKSFQLHSQDVKQNRLPCLKKTYYIAYHPVLIGNGLGFPVNHMDSGIIMVNKLLEPICIEFKVIDTFKLYNYNYNIDVSKLDITKEYFRDEMARMNNIRGLINLYNLDGNISYEESGICMKDSDYPFLAIPNNKQLNIFALNLSRLLINFLGLKFTQFMPGNKELVNGSNSLTTADFLRETPADPYLILNPPVDPTVSTTNGIKYMDYDKKDINNEYYSAMIYNVMSLYPVDFYDICPKLTYQQYDYLIKKVKSCP